jgi:hypothetical protein
LTILTKLIKPLGPVEPVAPVEPVEPFEPLAPAIIKANLDWLQINLWTDVIKGEGNFDPVINKYTQLEYSSWILLLYHHVEAEAFRNHAKEIFKENQKSLKDLHILRGQFERKIY